MDLTAYMQWAREEPRLPPACWKSYRPIRAGAAVRDLTLEKLCGPLFKVDPPPPKRISDDRLQAAWATYSKLPRQPDPQVVELLLQQTKGLLALFPEFDLIYVARAGALTRLSRYAEAEMALAEGFHRCSVMSALCDVMGDVCLAQGEPRAFGWYMQACHLGYESFAPYLLLAEAAAVLGMTETRLRLLNAVDSLNSSLPRLPASNGAAPVVVKDRDRLAQAFGTFLEYAEVYLPPADALPAPEDERQRSTAAILLRGDPGGLRPSSRICSRAFARGQDAD